MKRCDVRKFTPFLAARPWLARLLGVTLLVMLPLVFAVSLFHGITRDGRAGLGHTWRAHKRLLKESWRLFYALAFLPYRNKDHRCNESTPET
jgi:hypothetical protein